jgi:hypothetical protein
MTSDTKTGKTFAVYGRTRHGETVRLTGHVLSFGEAVSRQVNLNKIGRGADFAFFLVRKDWRDFRSARYIHTLLPGDRFAGPRNFISFVEETDLVQKLGGGYYMLGVGGERVRGMNAVAEFFGNIDEQGFLVKSFAYKRSDVAS